ncbi:MAG: peptidoglycan bridge formation glycyltransferase FemA/FemB family protein [Clostridia bacterium]
MPVLDLNDKLQVEKYKKFVDNRRKTSLLQSVEWKQLKKDWKQEIVYLEQENEIVAGLTLLIRKMPLLNTHIMYAPRGPVADVSDIEMVKKLIEEAEPIRKKYNACVLRFDPEIPMNKEIQEMYEKEGFVVRNEGVDMVDIIQPRFNMILNMEGKDEETLMKNFAEKTRYNIRLSGRKGVTVRHSRSIEDLKTFCSIQEITGKRDGFLIRPNSYFEKMLEIYDENVMRIYLAEHEGDVLSAALAMNYGGKMWYMYGASSNVKRNLMPNYAMQWAMIKWGIEQGCSEYDFGGVYKININDGLYKFKSGFCKSDGETAFIGEIDKVYNKFNYFVFVKMIPIFKKVRMFFMKTFKKV